MKRDIARVHIVAQFCLDTRRRMSVASFLLLFQSRSDKTEKRTTSAGSEGAEASPDHRKTGLSGHSPLSKSMFQ